MSEVTQILQLIEQGDPKAAEGLLPLVYEELRRLAAAKMAQQPEEQTLQATALVHEAWLRLVDGPNREYASRRHFFSAAAQAMRHLLIERARRKLRERHGGLLQRVDLDDVADAAPTDDERLIQINTALEELALLAPEKAEIVKLRFFVGLDEQEIAELLNLSPRTVERYWAYAKAWLFERIPK
jgi:RNA polymerase sigma factor (TIGR02999 family)